MPSVIRIMIKLIRRIEGCHNLNFEGCGELLLLLHHDYLLLPHACDYTSTIDSCYKTDIESKVSVKPFYIFEQKAKLSIIDMFFKNHMHIINNWLGLESDIFAMSAVLEKLMKTVSYDNCSLVTFLMGSDLRKLFFMYEKRDVVVELEAMKTAFYGFFIAAKRVRQ